MWMGADLVDGKPPDDGLDVSADHALDALRVLVPRFDFPLVPKTGEGGDVVRLTHLQLLAALEGRHIQALLDERSITQGDLAGFSERDVRVSAQHFLLLAAAKPIAQDPGRSACPRTGIGGYEHQVVADASVNRACVQPGSQRQVRDCLGSLLNEWHSSPCKQCCARRSLLGGPVNGEVQRGWSLQGVEVSNSPPALATRKRLPTSGNPGAREVGALSLGHQRCDAWRTHRTPRSPGQRRQGAVFNGSFERRPLVRRGDAS